MYAIDLSVAVAEGVLDSYQDTFDRSFQVDTTAPYFLGVEHKSVIVEDIETTLVVENAPDRQRLHRLSGLEPGAPAPDPSGCQ